MKHVAVVLTFAVLAYASLSGAARAGELTDLAKQAESDAKAGKHLEAYDTIRKAALTEWEAAPLLFRKSLFVAGDPGGFGIYDPRADNVFKKGEKLVIYVEPVGFTWQPKDGLNNALLVADLIVKDGEGTVVAQQEGFGTFTFKSHEKNMEVMSVLTIDFSGAPAGKYIAELKFNDKLGDKSASFELPFEIKEAQ
ncbi:hypothetical protein AUC69_00845 [Methyloceanibacter superfactus]|jgi:hypothetical protein|uniref:Uncharacterized protein n=1 Tax=Methyloceanibacter superfactus TaxID=1774969 RepID=A0A1E3W5Q5_9HYPH|nr:hypothetical protein [Methyloceanibacter superfactus]ODS00447.1 hypothetical protein AUC69_00845 [Methyloceanibacter superfactus]